MTKPNCVSPKIQQVSDQLKAVFPASKDHWTTRAEELLLVLLVGLPSLKKYASDTLSYKCRVVRRSVDCDNILTVLNSISIRKEAKDPTIQQSLSFFLHLHEECNVNGGIQLSGIIATMMSYISKYIHNNP